MKGFSYLLILLAFYSCNQKPQKQSIIEEVSLGVTNQSSGYPEVLSEWSFFKQPMNRLDPNERTIPYSINAALFSDYAYKARFVYLPQDSVISFHGSEVLEFPIGSVLIKNFYYPTDFKEETKDQRILETRLLIRESQGWHALVYQWNDAQTEAQLLWTGAEVPVEWTDEQGNLKKINYSIPTQPQCKSCHDQNGKLQPIGPTARQLKKQNQLKQWHQAGLLNNDGSDTLEALVDYMDVNQRLDKRARAWLEINCAHCHRREGPAKNSGLYLLASENDSYRIGIRKPPIAAGKGSGGLKHSIVPGSPEKSILVHRIKSLEPGEMMPELGRKLQHQEGILLIEDWIREMK